MKWNAIITKSQYEKALQRSRELNQLLQGAEKNDEQLLLSILIRDFEQRQADLYGRDPQKMNLQADRYLNP